VIVATSEAKRAIANEIVIVSLYLVVASVYELLPRVHQTSSDLAGLERHSNQEWQQD
jgi:hypothetical protein